ncbi:lysophospholipid acyltransferase family protein [Marinobacteraceae bacterium S3BR75-40.1]
MTVAFRYLKTVWLFFWAALLTLLLFLPITIAALFGRSGNLAFNLTKIWAWVLLKLCRVHMEIHGRENISPGQRYVIISNHQSYFDPPVLVLALGLQYRWVIKKELRRIPLFGFALHASRNLFIDRSNGAASLKSIRDGVARLQKGTGLLFFAEGTRSPDGQLLPFKKGAFLVARDSGLPILPVTVNFSGDRLPKKSGVFTAGKVEVHIHPPYQPDPEAPLEAVKDRTRQCIASRLKPLERYQDSPNRLANARGGDMP